MNLNDLAVAMLKCPQTKTQTVFQHGMSVFNYFNDLITEDFEKFKLPDWFKPNQKELFSNLHLYENISLYCRFHDCGKYFCLQYDSDNNVHFPDHANVSKKLFLEATNNKLVANLIGCDMILHTESAEKIDYYLKNEWTKQDAYTLLLVALCEIHSNANMFGGIESDSFKIKWKKISQRGNQILKFYNK